MNSIHLTEAEERRCKEIALARHQRARQRGIQSYRKSSIHTDTQIDDLGRNKGDHCLAPVPATPKSVTETLGQEGGMLP